MPKKTRRPSKEIEEKGWRTILRGACEDLRADKRIWFAIGGNVQSYMLQITTIVFGSTIYKDQDRIGVYSTMAFWIQFVNIPYIIFLGWILIKSTSKNNYDLKA
jgi:hypothetical protein